MGDEWEVKTLREAGVVLFDCLHKTPPDSGEGFPYIAIPQMKDGHIDLKNVRRISAEDLQTWTQKISPKPWDVIVSRRCNPGETAVVPPGLMCAIGQNLVLLRTDGSHIHPRFLRWLVRGPQWWDQVQRFINVGAVFESLKCVDIPEFKLPVPPWPEQKAIAHILGSLDDKIELNRKTNETLEAMARAIFRSWFVDFDPVRAKAEGRQPEGMDAETAGLFPDSFQDSELGMIPKGWCCGSVADQCNRIFSGGTPSTKEPSYWGGKLLWLSSGETRNPVITTAEKTITEEGVNSSSTRLAREGCTVIASAGQGHTRGQASLLACETYINQSVVALESDGAISSDTYLFLDLSGRYEEFRRISDAHSSRGSLTTKLLAGVECVLPQRSVISVFDGIVNPLFAEIVKGLTQSQTLESLRDALLPKLMSGQIHIKDAEKFVENAA